MASTGAFFDSFEEMILKYVGHRGQSAVSGAVFPGMVTNPTFPGNYIRLCKSSPVGVVYPNAFAAVGGLNATFEPTAAEYEDYAPVVKNSFTTQWDVLETSLGNGIWQLSNKTQIQFAVPGGASTGCTLTHAILCFQDNDSTFQYGILAAELGSSIVIPNGGGGSGPLIDVGELTFREVTFA